MNPNEPRKDFSPLSRKLAKGASFGGENPRNWRVGFSELAKERGSEFETLDSGDKWEHEDENLGKPVAKGEWRRELRSESRNGEKIFEGGGEGRPKMANFIEKRKVLGFEK